jgi:hypothetical protein
VAPAFSQAHHYGAMLGRGSWAIELRGIQLNGKQ